MTVWRNAPWLASGAAVFFAALAIGSGLDRFTEYMPSSVRLVPEGMRVTAKRSEAAQALARGDFATAIASATVAIDRDPLDPRGAAFLGAAQQLAGDARKAEASFRLAASLGWREPLVQTYWFAREWDRGNTQAAATRLDALLRAHPDFAPAQGFLGTMENSPRGRAALVERLRAGSSWTAAYLTAFDSDDGVLRARARFIGGEGAGGLALGCDAVLPMVQELLKRNYRADANALLAAQCPAAAASGPLADGEFDRFGEDIPGGLGWQRHGSGDTRITPVGGGEGRGVELANRSGVTRLLLSQPVALPQGSYVVRAAIPGAGAERLLPSLDCGAPQRPAQGKGSAATTGMVVAARECPDQVFGLWLRPGEGSMIVNTVTIEPLQPASASKAP